MTEGRLIQGVTKAVLTVTCFFIDKAFDRDAYIAM